MPVKDKIHSKATVADPEAVFPADAVQRQINRILSSPEFNATAAQKAFLKFVVETALAGRAHEIKGYTIATRVFGRGADFNAITRADCS
jgi:hypothetical protein